METDTTETAILSETAKANTFIKKLRGLFYSILRKSERFTKTDMVYLAKGTFWLNLAQVVSSIFGLLLSIAFAHIISQEVFGTYKFVLSTAGIITSFALSGLGSAALRAVAKGNEGDFLRVFFISLKWGLGLCLASFAISIYYFLQENHLLGNAFLIVGCFAPLLDSLELYPVLPTAKKDFRWVGITSMIRTIITSCGLLITLYITSNPLTIIFVYFLLHTITVSIIFILTYRSFKQNTHTDKDTLRLGGHLSFLNLSATVADKIDQILLFHYLGPIQLAIYNYSIAIPNNLQTINKTIGVMATPKYATLEKTLAQKHLFSKSFKLFLLALPIVILYYFIAPKMFSVLFPRYIDSIYYSQIYSLTLLVSAVLPLSLLEAHVAIKEKYILNITSSVTKIAIVSVGIFYFGIWGAIIGRIISKLFGISLAFFFARRI
jgi:O-antigen/teichoic acid export membrane protein